MNQNVQTSALLESTSDYNQMLLVVAGLGGLIFGVDVGIIVGDLTHLGATPGLSAGQLSFILFVFLLVGISSTLFTGALADPLRRKTMLTLSNRMPRRIIFNGMSIVPMINIAISTTIAALFLPTSGQYGSTHPFSIFASRTMIYFIIAAFFLPDNKGSTVEDIEAYFVGKK
jgi:MFS family permease